jgi:hypothetical protein
LLYDFHSKKYGKNHIFASCSIFLCLLGLNGDFYVFFDVAQQGKKGGKLRCLG